MKRRRVDLVAAGAAALAAIMIAVYLAIISEQSNHPAAWFLALVAAGAIAAAYGAYRGAPHRRTTLTFAGFALFGAGLPAILSIGFPILVAGVLALVAAARPAASAPATLP